MPGGLYCVDTSALLDGWVRHYPPDVFPALWSRIDQLIEDGRLIATVEVLVEIERKDDDLFAWVKKRKDALFIQIDEPIQLVVADILAQFPKLVDTRRNRSAADPFVIALAQFRSATVVTGERPTNTPHRPNIPDVCSARSIPCIPLLKLIRNERWIFKTP